LALINGPTSVRDAWEREQGFVSALKEYNVPLDPRAVVHGHLRPEGGVQGWEQLKSCSERPTAVICGDDEIAFGVLDALARDKDDCPQEVSVVGFDDSRWARAFSPALTTVRQTHRGNGTRGGRIVGHAFAEPIQWGWYRTSRFPGGGRKPPIGRAATVGFHFAKRVALANVAGTGN